MAINVAYAPSARTALNAQFESALQNWREQERRRSLQEQLTRDQMAQQEQMAAEQRALQERMQQRGINDAQYRQKVDWQGRSYLQDDQQSFAGEQAYYNRNQEVGLQGMKQDFYAGQNAADRNLRTYLQDDQQQFVGDQSAAAQQSAIANREDTQAFQLQSQQQTSDNALQNQIEYLTFQGDESTRQRIQEYQRALEMIDDPNAPLTDQEREMARRQAYNQLNQTTLSPQPPPENPQDLVRYIEIDDGINPPRRVAVMKNENGQWEEFANRNQPTDPNAKLKEIAFKNWSEAREAWQQRQDMGVAEKTPPPSIEEFTKALMDMDARFSGQTIQSPGTIDPSAQQAAATYPGLSDPNAATPEPPAPEVTEQMTRGINGMLSGAFTKYREPVLALPPQEFIALESELAPLVQPFLQAREVGDMETIDLIQQEIYHILNKRFPEVK